MKRRDFIMFFGGAAAWHLSLFWPSAGRAQNPPAGGQPATGPAGQAAPAGQVGQVATVQGSATVTRGNGGPIPLQVGDPIFKNDTLITGANSALGVTFDDETTFSLSAATRIVVNEFVYQEGGSANSAVFNVAVGTAAFVASQVAKTGDMKIATPIATLGIRGTTGVVDVPPSGAGEEPRIKLYADSDGHVGRIEVFNPQGASLGALTQGASAFALRAGPGGRFQAVPFRIPAFEAARDRGVLQRLFATHTIGRRMTIQRLRSRGFNRPPGRPGGRQPFNRNPRGGPPPRRGNPSGRGRR
jgi:FecR protein